MNKLLKILFSPRTTLGLLVIFAISMGVATFIENSYDTITAKILVYNATWFEALMVLMIINFIGSIKRYQLLTWKKIPGFIFHVSFIIMIIGAGITRYIGFEGRMSIREGASSNFIFSNETYLNVRANDGAQDYTIDKLLTFGMVTDNSFQVNLETANKGTVEIAYKNYLKRSREIFVEGTEGGFTMLNLTISDDGGHKHEIQLREGESQLMHNIPVSFNNNQYPNAVKITGTADQLFISYPAEIKTATMPSMEEGIIIKDSLGDFSRMHLYQPQESGLSIVLTKVLKNTVVKYVESESNQNGPEALILDVIHNGKTKEVTILGGAGYIENYIDVPLEGITLKMAYGVKKINLPFSIQLNKFELERYAGSMSPSSYASEVTLIDPQNGVRKDHRIFMNNVLDYGGYRFFQSSYDQDEKGTVLSVNYDFWGTWITYFAYALMIFGFIWTLFNKHSRYWELMGKIKDLRAKRKLLSVLVVAFLMSGTLVAQEHNHEVSSSQYSVSEAHAVKFGKLITQTYNGRFAPVHTVAIDVIHKISRKDKIDIPGRGKMSAMQVFLDLPLNPNFWKNQKIIYVSDKSVTDLINTSGKLVAFNAFFNEKGQYKLQEFAEVSFRKPDGERNKFDKEIIKINERLEVFMMAYQGHMLDIFPVQNSENNKWVSWDDQLASRPLTGSILMINDDLQLPVLNYSNIMRAYFSALIDAAKTADYSKADKILGYINSIQRQSSTADLIPSETKVQKEITYNKSNIFINLKNVYGLLSLLLLVLAFIDNLRAKTSKIVSWSLNVCIAILGVAFIYHTYGMGMRWYLSGHAPWSNGYEALILISWSSLLAGFSFMRYSKITLAATSLLAFFTLMTASHSSYDPQLTNLVPVLKSYWLIIHVATLTISYGFLGLGFILGLFNMGIYLIKTPKNSNRLSLITKELTYINEMNLTIGLFLATVGTFLGGVWANESWGRYWGWDSKETWALVITVVYTIILHFRLAPKLKGEFIFNVASIFGFGSVLMTFIGVNYYFTKGMHSYGGGETPMFPMWAWITILSVILLIVIAGIKEMKYRKSLPK
ncbi:cytochrome c biogenesis protein CcsA [Lutibacter sp.]|uniref:cytochrome c biogenesis protein CcsA n=1 Tax=Lutibacter sp. TaxID=1925666 RepID=UPI003567085F